MAAALVDESQSSIEAQRDLCSCHDRLGDAHLDAGDVAAALMLFQSSLAIRQRLVAAAGDDLEIHRDLAISHAKIGTSLRAQKNQPGATAAYREALTIAEALAARDSANPSWQGLLSAFRKELEEPSAGSDSAVRYEPEPEDAADSAVRTMNRAHALQSQGEHEKAREMYARSIDVLQRLVQAHSTREVERSFALARMNAAGNLRQMGCHAEAIELLQPAVASFERLLTEGDNDGVSELLASSVVILANTHASLDQSSVALPLYDRAIALYRTLVEGGRDQHEHLLTIAKTNKANCLFQLDRVDAALSLYEEAVGFSGDAGVPMPGTEMPRTIWREYWPIKPKRFRSAGRLREPSPRTTRPLRSCSSSSP